MTVAMFVLLLLAPFWAAFLPAALLAHRIGVMMHEYIHGIPFRRYANDQRVLAFFDGLMLMFGSLELFRAIHLAHHRWLNAPGDSVFDNLQIQSRTSGFQSTRIGLEIAQHLKLYSEALRGLHPYARARGVVYGMVGSFFWIAFWIAAGRPDMIWKLLVLTAFTAAVPVSLRGAIEHYADPAYPGFANEYRTLIPLFNLNRHVHHHENPRLPWYLLEFRTPRPLLWPAYFTYWFHAYVRKDFALMHPMREPPATALLPGSARSES